MQKGGIDVQLNQAVSLRIKELLEQQKMTQYQLFVKSGVPKSTLSNLLSCSYDSVKLRILHEICQGFEISLPEFFDSPLFDENNLDP